MNVCVCVSVCNYVCIIRVTKKYPSEWHVLYWNLFVSLFWKGKYIMRQTISSHTFITRQITESINLSSRHWKPKLAISLHQCRWCLSYGILQSINYASTAALWALRHDLRLITRFTANPLSLFRSRLTD